jgi:hypothetical protein
MRGDKRAGWEPTTEDATDIAAACCMYAGWPAKIGPTSFPNLAAISCRRV